MKKSLWIVILILLILAVALIYVTCIPKKTIKLNDYSAWISEVKDKDCNKPLINFSISECSYNGITVYPISYKYGYPMTRACTDEFTEPVYYKNGTIFCWASGSITGKGDGGCPNFEEQKQNCQQVFFSK